MRWLLTAVAALVLCVALLAGVARAAAGDLDPSFGSGGKVLTDFGGSDRASAVALQPDGKIVAAGTADGDFALARYNPDGSLDVGFGVGGRVVTDFGGGEAASAVALQPDGKIVAAGTGDASGTYDFALARYNADGSLDASFGTGGKVVTDLFADGDDEASAVALQPDGKIVVAGTSNATTYHVSFALARYNTDGSLDASFGGVGWVQTEFWDIDGAESVSEVALQRDGKIVAAGWAQDRSGSFDFALARYRTDGSLDASFGRGGMLVTDFGGFDEASALALLPSGRIVATGASNGGGSSDFALARYNFDGSLDAGFGSGGKVLTDFGGSSFDWAAAVAPQPDGKIVAAGVSGSDFALVRYLGEVPAPGAADLTVNERDRPDPVAVGETLSYVILVANNGPQDAVDVDLQDDLPGSVAFLSARTRHGNCTESSGVVRCELGTFPAGDRTTVQIDVQPTQARRIRNAVTVYSGTYDPDTSNNTARVRTTVVER